MPETVIVLHGLGLNKYWMSGLAWSLKRHGYNVRNISYSSRQPFERIVDETVAALVNSQTAEKIHFAAHSMGGLLVRRYAEKYGTSRIGRVVMLGTPNHGSEAADFFYSWPLYRWLFRGTGEELVTGENGVAARLGPVTFECGVIAGNNHWFHFPAQLLFTLPKPNDGLVSVASTRIEGMKDHITLWLDHSLMVWHPVVWRQVPAFLKNGVFQR